LVVYIIVSVMHAHTNIKQRVDNRLLNLYMTGQVSLYRVTCSFDTSSGVLLVEIE